MNKLRYLVIVVCLSFVPVNSYGVNIFRQMSETITGSGVGEITDLGDGQFEITTVAPLSGNKGETVKKWRRTADQACNGKIFETINRRWDRSNGLILEGTIQCAALSYSMPKRVPGKNRTTTANGSGSDENVKNAQVRLGELGYSPGGADGYLGPGTMSAIEEFQGDNTLHITGNLNRNTLDRLYSVDVQGRKTKKEKKTDIIVSSPQAKKIDIAAQLREFNTLRQNGAITEEEFALLKEKAMKQYLAQ